jgi:mono/diheme cytochrome c family protein
MIHSVTSICAPLPFAVAVAVAVVGLTGAGLSAAADAPATAAKPSPPADRIERGRYLVDTGGCGDCHTPLKMGKNGPEPDLARLLSGHPEALKMPPAPKLPAGPWLVNVAATNTAWSGPWGVSFTANLTPDAGTGLGGWSAKQFADTLRTGKHLGVGREILPPMPIPAYKNFNDADLAAIFAYLQSIPAVKNRVPAPRPPAAPALATK